MKQGSSWDSVRHYWDAQATTFDQEADHGLTDPNVYAAWATLFETWLSDGAVDVLDIGCGTGSLSLLLAAHGHRVTSIDLSPAMIERARAKANSAELTIPFHIMNATDPTVNGPFDAIVCRHLLWALPDPKATLQKWGAQLRTGGKLILVEGRWNNDSGLTRQQILQALPSNLVNAATHTLGDDATLWGRPVDDDRYAIIVVKQNNGE